MFRAFFDGCIEFYGIDPITEENITFKARDSIFTRLTGGFGRFDSNAPGVERAISATADDLRFGDNEVDTILSCWLILIWINKRKGVVKNIYKVSSNS
jgi:hypothetical protein